MITFQDKYDAGFHSQERTMYYSDNGRACPSCGSTCYGYSVRVSGSDTNDHNVYARCFSCNRIHAFPFTLPHVVSLPPEENEEAPDGDLCASDLSALHRSPNLLVLTDERAA